MPDKTLFPKFDLSLRAAMKAETEALFHEIAFNDLPADQLITATFTLCQRSPRRALRVAPSRVRAHPSASISAPADNAPDFSRTEAS